MSFCEFIRELRALVARRNAAVAAVAAGDADAPACGGADADADDDDERLARVVESDDELTADVVAPPPLPPPPPPPADADDALPPSLTRDELLAIGAQTLTPAQAAGFGGRVCVCVCVCVCFVFFSHATPLAPSATVTPTRAVCGCVT